MIKKWRWTRVSFSLLFFFHSWHHDCLKPNRRQWYINGVALMLHLARSRDKWLLQGLVFEINMALRTVFQIRPKIRLRRNISRSRILAGFRKTAGFRPEAEPKYGTAPDTTPGVTYISKGRRGSGVNPAGDRGGHVPPKCRMGRGR